MKRQFEKEKYKVAAFDLDGTLIDRFQPMPTDVVKEALVQLGHTGVAVVVSSGRDRSQIVQGLMECFSYAVLTNGAVILDAKTGKTVWEKAIEHRLLYRTIKTVKECGGFSFLMQNGIVRGTRKGEKVVFGTMMKDAKKGKGNGYSTKSGRYTFLIQAANRFARPTYKVQAFFRNREDSLRAAELLRKERGLEVLSMYGTTLEVTAAGVTKAAALDVLCGMLGTDRNALVAFGDSRNDLEMLEAAGYAVVMENGEECVKEIADAVAPHVREDGAATAIRELFKLN